MRKSFCGNHCYLFFFLSATIAWSSARAQYETSEWKELIAAGHLPYHKLSSADFPVSDRDYPEPVWVNPFLTYRYDYDSKACDGDVCVTVTSCRGYSGIDKSSGRKSVFSRTTEMLPFLQGYLDIHEIYCRRLAAIPASNLPDGRGSDLDLARKDLERQLDALCRRTLERIDGEIHRYVAETRDGNDRKELERWISNLSSRLKKAAIIDRYSSVSKLDEH